MTRRHQCPTCGFLHNAPKASGLMVSLILQPTWLAMGILAALALSGWLSVFLWVFVAVQGLTLAFLLAGLAIVSTGELRGERP